MQKFKSSYIACHAPQGFLKNSFSRFDLPEERLYKKCFELFFAPTKKNSIESTGVKTYDFFMIIVESGFMALL